ncbi:Flp pilus assembly complex ATPase component TadA [Candidatus Woesearchaeota archaeon]|nr:Flp pilus assembly complex ATPase component TadA [Candidatus Woesearchaeota archaeon]MBW3022086.1 Flp pilus assembly complex ATPase component TadA [Candidatus Woesearchaeota archaeon]
MNSIKLLDAYKIKVNDINVRVNIFKKATDFVPTYKVTVTSISPATNIILQKIRDEFVTEIKLGHIKYSETAEAMTLRERFKKEIGELLTRYFPNIDEASHKLLLHYIIQQDLGLGDVETLLKDEMLEEIVINNANEPVWVYHIKHGWLKTNIVIPSEDTIRHYATMIAKDVSKEITVLKPLLDAHLATGDRVNATLQPISNFGNTITIRKFRRRPWSITDFIINKSLNYEVAATVWQAVQFELSTIVSGGTASGKTSMLNAVANFFPPNQRIISIEDTRELTLPKSLHWVPLETRQPNPEGKGGVTMLDLVVNSLRMRPDRIVVGEIRRKKEAEVLFEAMHTGHSVYGTIHANNAKETIARLTNPPIDIPKAVIPALSMILVQNRNRRTGLRRTLQIAEILENGDSNVLIQHDAKTDSFRKIGKSKTLLDTLNLYTGMSSQEIRKDILEKIKILKDLVKNKTTDVNDIGLIMANHYQK